MYLGSRPHGGGSLCHASNLAYDHDGVYMEPLYAKFCLSNLSCLSNIACASREAPAWLYICNQARVYKCPSRIHIGVAFLRLQVDIIMQVKSCRVIVSVHLHNRPDQVTRVNSTNVLDEGLRIGEIGRWMNSKVKLVEISIYRK
jgi:hypothetical protein